MLIGLADQKEEEKESDFIDQQKTENSEPFGKISEKAEQGS